MGADREPMGGSWRELFRFRVRGRWRPVAVSMFIVAGVLFVTTSVNSKGLDLRAASVTDLDHVVRAEREHVNDLQAEVTGLNKQISGLSHQVNDSQVTELQRKVDLLRGPSGFSPVSGPGLTVVLDDAPKSEIDAATSEPGGVTQDELVVHQQDIQAVVNALWAGGAEAMTIQGQRVISTTGIKCVGNTVILHGVPYSPPYRIAAIGSTADLQASLDNSDYVNAYLAFVDAYQLGYRVTQSALMQMPAYTGAATLKYARPGPAPTDTPR